MADQHDDSSREEVMQQLRALGYIDPGVGSSMWQIILAGFFRTSARVKSTLRKFLSVLGISKTSEEEE